MEALIKIGQIVSPHGVKGEVKVIPLTDYPERFYAMESVRVLAGECFRTNNLPPRTKIESVRFHKQFVIIKFLEIDSLDLAEKLRCNYLYILPEERVPLPPQTYYYDQIIGLTVINNTLETLGVIEDIFCTGSNDVYVIKTNKLTSSSKNKQLLLPALKSVVKKIDWESKRMYVDFPEELK